MIRPAFRPIPPRRALVIAHALTWGPVLLALLLAGCGTASLAAMRPDVDYTIDQRQRIVWTRTIEQTEAVCWDRGVRWAVRERAGGCYDPNDNVIVLPVTASLDTRAHEWCHRLVSERHDEAHARCTRELADQWRHGLPGRANGGAR